MQQKLKQAWKDPNKFNRQERNEKISKSLIGRHYYNNGIIEVKTFECPDNFIPGRLKNTLRTKKVKETMTGRKAYTNLKTKKVIYLKENQKVPEGFILGRLGNGGGLNKNYKIFNNGIIEKRCLTCPEGFQEGSLIEKVKQEYYHAKLNGSLLTWNEFRKEYKKNARKRFQ